MKKQVLISSILVTSLLISGCNTQRITSNKADVLQTKQLATVEKYQPKTIVEEFISASVHQEWDTAIKFLTNTAGNTMRVNLKRNTVTNQRLQNITTHVLTKGELFSLIKADITFSKDEAVPWMQVKQTVTYNYFLRKLNNQWKIYKVEMGSKDFLLPKTLYIEQIKAEVKEVVSKYINLTKLQKWEQAKGLLGGDALEKANSSILPNVKLKEPIKINNLKLQPIGSEKGIQLIEATYKLDNSLKKPSEMRLLFYVVQTEEGWKIHGIDIVNGGVLN